MIEIFDSIAAPAYTDFERFSDMLFQEPFEGGSYLISEEKLIRDLRKPLIIPDTILPEYNGLDLSTFYSTRACLRRVELLALPAAVFAPSSHAVISHDGKAYRYSLDYTIEADKLFEEFSNTDPVFRSRDGDTYIDVSDIDTIDEIAMPICGPGIYNFGHFLCDGLPLCLAMAQALPRGSFSIVGAKLRKWQSDLLKHLDLLHLYKEVAGPTRFKAVIASSILYGHVPAPTRFIRPVFDTIAFKISSARGPARVYLSRSDQDKRRVLNSDELEAALSKRGFVIHHPGSASLAETVSLVSSARVVVGQGGAGMANAGFCNPGTSVIEIQNAAFLDPWTRSLCALFNLDWHMYVARGRDGGTHEPFEIDVPLCMRLVDMVLSKSALVAG